MKYTCELCGFVYDEEKGDPRRGIAPGTPFEKLPEDFECTGCGFKKEAFNPVTQRNGAPMTAQSKGRFPIGR